MGRLDYARAVGAAAAEGDEGDEAGSEAGEARPPTWAVGCAVSEGGPLGPWSKLGRVLEGGAEGAWDERGIGTRHVVLATVGGTSQMVMVYEGVDDGDGTHRLGAARSTDGSTWEKDAGPVLEPGGAAGEWTTQVVGTPYLLPMADGKLRLYHCGKPIGAGGAGGGHCIGCLESDGDVTRDSWRPVLPPA